MSDSEQNGAVEIAIQRIYLKDLSFESPQSPQIFLSSEQPKVQLNLGSKAKKLEGDLFEVELQVNITAEDKKGVVFITEVEQVGLFAIKGAEGRALDQILGAYCPQILFPYVRETVDSISAKGSFPPLMLAPVNFDALYQQRQQQPARKE